MTAIVRVAADPLRLALREGEAVAIVDVARDVLGIVGVVSDRVTIGASVAVATVANHVAVATVGCRVAVATVAYRVAGASILFGWLCWSAFAASVVREVAWYTMHLPQLMRDRGVHAEHVAALSVRRSLAALCVGTLVVALLGLWRPHVASAQQLAGIGELTPQVAATAPLHPAPAWTAFRWP